MAKYVPAQPFWKRPIAGLMDFVLIFYTAGFVIARLFGQNAPASTDVPASGLVLKSDLFRLEGLPALVLLAVIIAYFTILGRNGGTVFQRAFGMKRLGLAPMRIR